MHEYHLSIHDYIRIFHKRKVLIFLVTLTFFVFSIAYYYWQKPIYQTSAVLELALEGQYDDVKSMFYSIRLKKADFSSYAEDIKNNEILKQAAIDLKFIKPDESKAKTTQVINFLRNHISIQYNNRSQTYTITVAWESGKTAADIANTVAKLYIQYFKLQGKGKKNKMLVAIDSQIHLLEIEAGKVLSKLQQLDSIKNAQDKILSLENQLNEINHKLILYKTYASEDNYFYKPAYLDKKTQYLTIDEMELEFKKLQDLLVNYTLKDYTSRHPSVLMAREQRAYLCRLLIEAYKEKKKIINQKINKLNFELNKKEKNLDSNDFHYLKQTLTDKYNRVIANLNDLDKEKNKLIFETSKLPLEVQILSTAVAPSMPQFPNFYRHVYFGIFLGLLLGIGMAFVIEALDTSISTIEEVEHTVGLPVLTVIPRIDFESVEQKQKDFNLYEFLEKEGVIDSENSAKKEKASENKLSAKLITAYSKKSPAVEAFRILRSGISHIAREKKYKIFQITSSGPQEGKSTISTNLAVVFNHIHKKTLLISGNLRRPVIEKFFNIESYPGMTEYLTKKVDTYQECIVKLNEFKNLHILPHGSRHSNPSDILTDNPRLFELFKNIRNEYDIIILDSPPVLPVADSMIYSNLVDAVCLVYYIGSAAREAVIRAKERLTSQNANIIGIVLNIVSPEAENIYNYYYSKYGYIYNYEADK